MHDAKWHTKRRELQHVELVLLRTLSAITYLKHGKIADERTFGTALAACESNMELIDLLMWFHQAWQLFAPVEGALRPESEINLARAQALFEHYRVDVPLDLFNLENKEEEDAPTGLPDGFVNTPKYTKPAREKTKPASVPTLVFSNTARRVLANALRQSPAPTSWSALECALRTAIGPIRSAENVAGAVLSAVRRALPPTAQRVFHRNALCALAKIDVREMGTKPATHRPAAVFPSVQGVPTLRVVAPPPSPPLPGTIFARAEDIAIREAIGRIIALAEHEYNWPKGCGAMFCWCEKIVYTYLRVSMATPILVRMKKSGLLYCWESGKVGRQNPLWVLQRHPVKAANQKPLPVQSDDDLRRIIEHGLWRFEDDVRRWSTRVLIPPCPRLTSAR